MEQGTQINELPPPVMFMFYDFPSNFATTNIGERCNSAWPKMFRFHIMTQLEGNTENIVILLTAIDSERQFVTERRLVYLYQY